ncbi:MAG: hypothetical protein ACKV2T_14235 [Kofleriaceae bacterium]
MTDAMTDAMTDEMTDAMTDATTTHGRPSMTCDLRETQVDTLDAADTFDAIIIVVPPEPAKPRREKRGPRSPHVNLALFFFVGLPAIALAGVVIGYAVTVL